MSRSAPPGTSGSAHVLRALLEFDVRYQLLAVGGAVPTRANCQASNLHLLPTEISLFGRGARFFAPIRQLLLGFATRRVIALAKAHRADKILCVFPDAFYCAAALAAARKLDKPLEIWFHNTYADNRTGIAGIYARRLEARIIEAAQRVYFISEGLHECFIKKYPQFARRFSVLPHPVPVCASNAVMARGFSEPVVRATLIGNINASNIDAAARLLRALRHCQNLTIRMCTPVPKMLLAARGVELDGIDFRGYLSATELAELMEDTDLFLLPHGLQGAYSQQEYRTIFPTRAAHYMAQGRAILAHSPEDCTLTKFLHAHGCAVVICTPSEEDILQAFMRLYKDPSRQLQIATKALRTAAIFDPASIIRALVTQDTQ